MRVSELIGLLGGRDTVASACGVRQNTVSCWSTRDSIPAPYWKAVEDLASRLGKNAVTFDVIRAMSKSQRGSR